MGMRMVGSVSKKKAQAATKPAVLAGQFHVAAATADRESLDVQHKDGFDLATVNNPFDNPQSKRRRMKLIFRKRKKRDRGAQTTTNSGGGGGGGEEEEGKDEEEEDASAVGLARTGGDALGEEELIML